MKYSWPSINGVPSKSDTMVEFVEQSVMIFDAVNPPTEVGSNENSTSVTMKI